VLPGPGCYEERYRLTGSAALVLASGLLAVGLGFVWHEQVIFTVIGVVLAVVAAMGGGVFAAARRMIAFRADQAGITLGALPGRHGSAVFTPWEDVEQIILYAVHPRGQGRYAQVRCIGLKRREGAAALSQGNEQAPGCPVPGVAAGATCRITGWRLDREHLAAVTALAAPGIPIVDASAGLIPGGDGPGAPASTPELGPAD
jgi:hypothetical protein